jgi:hypothetical protein
MIGGIWAGHIGGGESGLLLVFESLTSNDMTYLEYLLFHFFIYFRRCIFGIPLFELQHSPMLGQNIERSLVVPGRSAS